MTVKPRRPVHRKLASLPGKGRGHADSEEEAGGKTRLDSNWKGGSAKGSDEPMGNHQVPEAMAGRLAYDPRRWRDATVSRAE